jgi:hypothetical protein
MKPPCPPPVRQEQFAKLRNEKGTESGLLVFITPTGNDPRDCIYPISGAGEPIADGPGGVSCCAVGRCFTTGETSSCG